jgi:CRP-like cAMP-binding protein
MGRPMTPDQKAAALGGSALFADFTDTGKHIFAGIAAARTIAAGTPLFQENQAGESLFLVVAGTVRLTQHRAEGGEREVGLAGPGEALGELAVLAPGVRLLTAVAQTDCQVLEIGQKDFTALAPQKPQACLKLAIAIASRLARRVAESRDLLRDALARSGS